MASGNHITLTGNVTRDPELRFVPSGAAVAKFGLAVNRRWQNKSTQEWEEEVSFFDVVAWSDLAEHISESVSKGDRIVVDGRIDQKSWETDAGEKRYNYEVVADEVALGLRFATATATRVEKGSNGSKAKASVSAPAGGEEPF